ncbi:MAG: hypothetical protein U0174_09720 [Polyangiaceae bacterium]
MTSSVLIFSVVAIAALVGAGYLFGLRVARGAREALLRDWEGRGERIRTLDSDLSELTRTSGDRIRMLESELADQVRTSGERIRAELVGRDQEQGAFRDEVRSMLAKMAERAPDIQALQSGLQTTMAQVLARRDEGGAEMKKMMNEVLAPFADRERLGRALSSIGVGRGGLGELPTLLDAIAEKAAFAGVVLSDEAGLPLAASTDTSDVEIIAASAAFFGTLAERSERAGQPRPLSCLILDETNRTLLFRLFSVGDSRFALSAVCRGKLLAPGALDPALAPLEVALKRREVV